MTLDELSVVFTADIAPFSAAVASVSSLLSAAADQADSLAARFTNAGIQAGEGLRQGLLSRRAAVADAARALADAAANALRNALGIHSPSRVAMAAGSLFDEGLIRGIAGSAGQVEKEAALLSDRASSALRAPEFPPEAVPSPVSAPVPAAPSDANALSPISLTIPLEIDGYRLGVAAIEGINRVSQGTGRIELTI